MRVVWGLLLQIGETGSEAKFVKQYTKRRVRTEFLNLRPMNEAGEVGVVESPPPDYYQRPREKVRVQTGISEADPRR